MTDAYLPYTNLLISPSIASNNLTVAIKDYDGTNFSSSKPLVHKIGSTPRTLTGALSVTVNAGTNTFAAGATKMEDLPHDYFVYLGWRAASSTVFILISRIPYARTYADFSATATNELYGAYSGSAPASTDAVENVGRFRAQNSGSASFNWSIPTAVTVHRPIYETDELSWTPIFTGLSVGNGTLTSKYKLVDKELMGRVALVWGNTTSISGSVSLTMPFAAVTHAGTAPRVGECGFTDAGIGTYAGPLIMVGGSFILEAINTAGTYGVMTNLSSTIPFTWVTTDEITIWFRYPIAA
jgi:hypothetical protein